MNKINDNKKGISIPKNSELESVSEQHYIETTVDSNNNTIIHNYYITQQKINQFFNFYNYYVRNEVPPFLKSPVKIDKLIIRVDNKSNEINEGFYSQLIKNNINNINSISELIFSLSEEEKKCFYFFINQINQHDFNNNIISLTGINEETINEESFSFEESFQSFFEELGIGDQPYKIREYLDSKLSEDNLVFTQIKKDDFLKYQFYKVFNGNSLGSFTFYPSQSLKIQHSGEHFKSINSSDYMNSIALLHKVALNLERVRVDRIDLAVDIDIDSEDNDFIQHFIYAYLIKRIHIPSFKKDKINFINFNSLVNDISSLNPDDFKVENALVEPIAYIDGHTINNINLIKGFYVGNVKYHDTSLCVYYKHIQEGSLKKKIRFEVRFKRKKAYDIFFEIIDGLQQNMSYEEITNFIFHREFRNLISVKKYPKIHKSAMDDPRKINENKQLYKVKTEAPWFAQLCNFFSNLS